MSRTDDPYVVLGVDRASDEAAIRRSYRRAAKKAHPDAGGSAEAFAKVQRALAILTNPTTRDRFDRTGEAEPEGPDTEQTDIMSMATQALINAIGEGDVRFSDIIAGAVRQIDAKMREVGAEIQKHKREANDSINRLESAAKRLRRKKGSKEPDLLGSLLAGQVVQIRAALERNLAQLEPSYRKLAKARDLLLSYEYEYERVQRGQPGFRFPEALPIGP